MCSLRVQFNLVEEKDYHHNKHTLHHEVNPFIFLFLFSIGNMSSEVRMAPRPAKTGAWGHGLLPSPIDDPSSCSDNASDNSDKIESYCQSQTQGNGNKTRKRKIVGGPSFMNSGGPLHDGTNRGQQIHESIVQHQQQQKFDQKDANESRNSLTQGDTRSIFICFLNYLHVYHLLLTSPLLLML